MTRRTRCCTRNTTKRAGSCRRAGRTVPRHAGEPDAQPDQPLRPISYHAIASRDAQWTQNTCVAGSQVLGLQRLFMRFYLQARPAPTTQARLAEGQQHNRQQNGEHANTFPPVTLARQHTHTWPVRQPHRHAGACRANWSGHTGNTHHRIRSSQYLLLPFLSCIPCCQATRPRSSESNHRHSRARHTQGCAPQLIQHKNRSRGSNPRACGCCLRQTAAALTSLLAPMYTLVCVSAAAARASLA
jgi:hypothetical protein